MTTGTNAGRLSAIALEQLRKMELEGELEKAGESGGFGSGGSGGSGHGEGRGGGGGHRRRGCDISAHPAAALPSTPHAPPKKALRRHGGAGFAQSFAHGSAGDAAREDHALWNDPTYLPCETVRRFDFHFHFHFHFGFGFDFDFDFD